MFASHDLIVVSITDRDRTWTSYWDQNGAISILSKFYRYQIFNISNHTQVSDDMLYPYGRGEDVPHSSRFL